jgi:hypothetical protein
MAALCLAGVDAAGTDTASTGAWADARPQAVGARAAPGGAAVPMPRPRPAPTALPAPPAATAAPAARADQAVPPQDASACRQRLAELALAAPLAPIDGPGACQAEDVVQLTTIRTAAGGRIALTPPAVLRCEMAEAVALWVRERAEPLLRPFGPLAGIAVAASFSCRGRNNVAGAKMSEHGLANAIDLRGFTLASGASIVLTDAAADKTLRERLRDSACSAFTTVLGPGSDGYHEEHIHLDRIERRSGYRMCQWAVREPAALAAAPEVAVNEPPASDTPATAAGSKPPLPIAPPWPRARADQSASCAVRQACPRAASRRRERAPRRPAARRPAGPLAIFRW